MPARQLWKRGEHTSLKTCQWRRQYPRKRSHGRWEGRYTAGYDPKTGKRINKNVLGRTQAEVKEKLKAAMAECQGLDVSRAANKYTVATWLRTWYELYAKPNVRTATANRCQLIIEVYTIPRIGDIQLKRFTIRHLQKLYKELLESRKIHSGKGQNTGLSTTTVRCAHLMLHAALERAVKERLIPRNPTEDCIAPKPRKIEMQILPSEDIHAYLEAANARDLLPMFYLELVSGLRKGELWPYDGTTWISRIKPFPSASNMSVTRTASWSSPVPRQKTLCGWYPSRKQRWIC